MPNDLKDIHELGQALAIPADEVRRLIESCRLLPVAEQTSLLLYDRLTLAQLRDELNRRALVACGSIQRLELK